MTNNTNQKSNQNPQGTQGQDKDRDGQKPSQTQGSEREGQKQGPELKHDDHGNKKQAGESDRKDPGQGSDKR